MHDHDHDPITATRAAGLASELRARALEALLVERGLISTDAIDAVVEYYENDVGPQNGARVIARAWVDPAYRERLLRDGTAAIAELGYGGVEGDHMVVVENTPDVHNVIVCTLCSCYPWPVLGLPPTWYKSDAYRARVVAEPRARAARARARARRRRRAARVGLERRDALPRAARAARGHRGPERGAARRARHPRRDDRRGARRAGGAAREHDARRGRRRARRLRAAAAAPTASSCSTRSGTAARSAWASSCWSGWAAVEHVPSVEHLVGPASRAGTAATRCGESVRRGRHVRCSHPDATPIESLAAAAGRPADALRRRRTDARRVSMARARRPARALGLADVGCRRLSRRPQTRNRQVLSVVLISQAGGVRR